MKKIIAALALLCVIVAGAFGQSPASVRRTVDYTIRDSVDNYGNMYIRAWSELPSVLTRVNENGSVTLCSSDESANTTHVYEYDINLKEQGTFIFQNELGSLGAFTKDSDGNYYFFYGMVTKNQNVENMAVVKYSREREKINTYKLKAKAPSSFDGIRIPFNAGTCRLELSGSMLAVYFAREMFSGHQASYGFVLDKDTFERIDRGAATNDDRRGGYLQMPYVSHSFNQFALPIDNGFIFADHGDAYPRSFTFAKFQKESNTIRVHAFKFPGGTGSNPTYAQMGGLAKTPTGYIFAGAYGRERNNPRNLFVLTFDEELTKCSSPIYLTKYTKEDGHAGHPKIVSLDDGRYLLLWEQFSFSTQSANSLPGGRTGYLSTFALVINETGETVSDIQELTGIRLNINDTLRYNRHNKKVYWAINDSDTSMTVYALDIGGL